MIHYLLNHSIDLIGYVLIRILHFFQMKDNFSMYHSDLLKIPEILLSDLMAALIQMICYLLTFKSI